MESGYPESGVPENWCLSVSSMFMYFTEYKSDLSNNDYVTIYRV